MLFNRIVSLLGILSLKGRLRFWFLSFLVVLILCASIPFVLFGKQQKREDAHATIEKTINLQQTVINNWFEERMADIKTVSQLPTVKARDLTRMQEALEALDDNHTEFNGIVYVNDRGISEIDTSGPAGIDLSDRAYFEEAKKGNTFITDVLIGRQSHTPIIIFSVPVYDDNENFQGLVFGAVPIKTINKIMAQSQDEASETYLVDENGMLITKSRQGEVGKLINTEIYREALKGKKLDYFYDTHYGEKVLGDYRWVHHNQWLIIGEIQEKYVYQPFYRMAAIFSIIFFLLGIIGYVLIIVVSNQIEAPIRNVLEGTRKIGQGSWGYRILKPSYYHDAKELQELSNNFNRMAQLIENHIDSVEKSEERFRMIADYSSDMITIHDSLGKYLYVSPAGKEILHYEDDEVIGFDSYHFIHPDDIDEIREHHESLLKTGYVVSTYRIRRKDGEYIWLESSIKCLKGRSPEEPQIIVISRNITERKLVEERLQEANRILHELSTKDGLTGVWNRRSFNERIEVEWNRALRNSDLLSLVMLDIDYFKAYNDTYGHQVGDDCLKEIAAELLRVVKRSGDMVFRYGGEEFCVILPGTDQAGAIVVAERIREAIKNLQIPHIGSQISDIVTMSFGTNTLVPSNDFTIEQLIVDADKALYKAKQDGRDCVRSCDAAVEMKG